LNLPAGLHACIGASANGGRQHGAREPQGNRTIESEEGEIRHKRQPDWTSLKVAWPQPKQAISLRIDQDVLTWFRDGGPGYQTRMNAVLRAFVDAQGKR